MKKYKMRIKDDNAEYIKYGADVYHRTSNGFLWLCDGDIYEYTSTGFESLSKEFTLEEIEKMPYGFVNQYDLIEVKEQLYYVKMPHLVGKFVYMNERQYDGLIYLSNKTDSKEKKAKFTKQEIEEKFPFYANDTCMVRVEGIE